MELFIITVLFLGGILAGLYASSVGGGLLLTFPLLIFSGLSTQLAIATNRFSAVILEFSSAAKFYSHKKINLKLGIGLGIIAACGSFIGSNLIIRVNQRYLDLITAIIFSVIAIILLNKNRFKVNIKKHGILLVVFMTFLLGIYGGFFGGGFGTFIMFAMVILGYTFIDAAALGRVIGFIMSIAATIVFAFNGLINYKYGLAIGLGCAIGSWIGIGIAIKKGEKYVKSLLIIVVILTVIKLLLGFFGINFL